MATAALTHSRVAGHRRRRAGGPLPGSGQPWLPSELRGGSNLLDEDDFRALFWLANSKSAEKRCLPVDSSQERFVDFTAQFTHPADWIDAGRVVLVTGDKGFGKTSLMQRCAAWLLDRSAHEPRYRLIVVDLSDARWPTDQTNDAVRQEPRGSDASDVRMQRTLDAMLDKLAGLALISPESRARIERPSRVGDRFSALGELLESLRDSDDLTVVMAVLLEGYPIPSEVTGYYNSAAKGMFFFAEMFRPEYVSQIAYEKPKYNRNSAYLHILPLGAVKPADLRAFADWIRDTGNNFPEFPDLVLDEIRSGVIQRESGVLELAKMMWGALRAAQRRGVAEVSTIDFVEYYAMQCRAIELANSQNNRRP
jgi:energy-coupling factor transporter ATP-binding protein EcfA2